MGKGFAAWCLRSRPGQKRICTAIFPERREVHHTKKVNTDEFFRSSGTTARGGKGSTGFQCDGFVSTLSFGSLLTDAYSLQNRLAFMELVEANLPSIVH